MLLRLASDLVSAGQHQGCVARPTAPQQRRGSVGWALTAPPAQLHLQARREAEQASAMASTEAEVVDLTHEDEEDVGGGPPPAPHTEHKRKEHPTAEAAAGASAGVRQPAEAAQRRAVTALAAEPAEPIVGGAKRAPVKEPTAAQVGSGELRWAPGSEHAALWPWRKLPASTENLSAARTSRCAAGLQGRERMHAMLRRFQLDPQRLPLRGCRVAVVAMLAQAARAHAPCSSSRWRLYAGLQAELFDRQSPTPTHLTPPCPLQRGCAAGVHPGPDCRRRRAARLHGGAGGRVCWRPGRVCRVGQPAAVEAAAGGALRPPGGAGDGAVSTERERLGWGRLLGLVTCCRAGSRKHWHGSLSIHAPSMLSSLLQLEPFGLQAAGYHFRPFQRRGGTVVPDTPAELKVRPAAALGAGQPGGTRRELLRAAASTWKAVQACS